MANVAPGPSTAPPAPTVLRNHEYTKERGNNLYPEQLANPWYSDTRGIKAADTLPSNFLDWPDTHVCSERTNIPIGLNPLPEQEVHRIAAEATSREDFHDYNWFESEEAGWGICLCEIRIIAAPNCKKELAKGKIRAKLVEEGKTLAKEGQPCTIRHWTWMLDIAPRGKVCPRAFKNNGVPCRDILGKRKIPELGYRKIPEEWVLATRPEDPDDTIPGRAVTDIIRRDVCMHCAYPHGNPDGIVIDEYNEVLTDPARQDKMNRSTKPELPVQYRPEGTHTGHSTLVVNDFYHKERLLKLGVTNQHWHTVSALD